MGNNRPLAYEILYWQPIACDPRICRNSRFEIGVRAANSIISLIARLFLLHLPHLLRLLAPPFPLSFLPSPRAGRIFLHRCCCFPCPRSVHALLHNSRRFLLWERRSIASAESGIRIRCTGRTFPLESVRLLLALVPNLCLTAPSSSFAHRHVYAPVHRREYCTRQRPMVRAVR